jgi:hypothetical protein
MASTPVSSFRGSVAAIRTGVNVGRGDGAGLDDDGVAAADWQIGDVAYALVSAKADVSAKGDDKLAQTADRLSRTLY